IRPHSSPLYGGASFHDGISFNAETQRVVLKAVGAAPTITTLTSAFTFTGDSSSMFMGPAGLLVQQVTNTPRIEYDASGNCLGLLMEGSRTNLALHSNDHTNVAWVKTTMTTAKTSTGPDGVTNSATRLTATAGNALSLQTVVSASATRAYSVWMRRITGTGNIDMTLDNGVGWTTRTLTSSWQRFEITQAAVTNPVFGIRIVTSGDAIDVYGNQMESAAFASSLMPTTTTTVGRIADSCTRVLSSEFSATAGTVIVTGRASGGQDATNGNHVFEFNNATSANRMRFFRLLGTDSSEFRVTDTSATQTTGLLGTFQNSTNYKAAMAYAANDFAFSFNGAAVATDAAGTIPAITTLGLGMSSVASDA
ncbi:MAG: hypothetical protein EBR82_86050, partial [Caulobacteraceae bacterium]|nr:hypothetical protein [Caulobacteraceae bacterium]